MNYFIFLAFATLISKPLEISSAAFAENEFIPSKYTAEGENINPELKVDKIPSGTKTLALIMDDPDAPNGTFDHWVVWNIPVMTRIDENNVMGVIGLNGKKENKYFGPHPPSGIHHYHFKVYALDCKLELPERSGKAALEKAMAGHILGSGELVGLYEKKRHPNN